MKESILDDKRILAVDDEPDVLQVIKEEIEESTIGCVVDTATTYEKAVELIASWTYDLAILDIMGVQGLTLLDMCDKRPYPIPVVILTAHALSPEFLKEAIERGARAYLPKQTLGSLVPYLEDVMTYEYGPVWKRILKQVEGVFNESQGPYWRNADPAFWKEFEEKIS